MEVNLSTIFSSIDFLEENFVERLRKAVEFHSVSAWPICREEVIKVIQWAGEELKKLSATVEFCDIGEQTLHDGSNIPLPPVLLAELGNDPAKKVVLIYGHLDVQPADIKDGWDTDPFTLIEKHGNMYGRGTTDDKGPVMSWINAIEAIYDAAIDLPVNIKFCLEGMEEASSEGLEQFLVEKKDTFLKDVDYVVISDNNWLNRTKPCITYGLRGICSYYLEVTCAKQDLHSGIFGGAVPEAMIDCVHLLSTLVDRNGRIRIPGIYDKVQPLSEEEERLYETIDFDVSDFQSEVGCASLLHTNKAKLLQHCWRYPSLSLHGIEGAFSEPGCKTVIPRKVIGKFSIRVVPNQEPDELNSLVAQHLEKMHEESGSSNTIRVFHEPNSSGWVAKDYLTCPSFAAARRAIKRVWQVEPDMIREGGSIPVTSVFQNVTGKSVLLLPMGQSDDGAHSQNEKLARKNYIQGTKVMAAYLFELGQVTPE